MSMTWLANADSDTAWAHAAWPDFAQAVEPNRQIALLPVFGWADHGLGVALDAEEVVGSEILHRAVLETKSALSLRVLPPLRFGLAPYATGVFGIDPETAHDLTREIATSVKAAGCRKLVFFVTSPWQAEFIDAASRDIRVELELQTFVINLAGLGLSFHPTSSSRAKLQAMAAQLLGTPPAKSRPGISVEPNFRPGRWDQPPPVERDPAVDTASLFAEAGAHLARLLGEIDARAPLGSRDHRRPVKLPRAPARRHPATTAVWPSYRDRYLPALTRDALEAIPDKERAFVIIPTGAIEQHGPHLPVGVDAILGQAWLNAALPQLQGNSRVWVGPPITFGKSNEHTGFPGTVSVSAKTLRRLLLACATQLKALGFRQLGVLNTHGGNSSVLVYTLREIQTTLGLRAGMIGNPFRPPLSEQESLYGFHAGEWETALMLAVAPETVRMDRAVSEFPAHVDDPGELRPESAPATFSWITRDISKSGVMGDATAATPEKGRDWLASASTALAARIAELICVDWSRD
jgi:creatinine amidohydrolase